MLNVNPGWPLDKTLRATFEDMPGDGWSELVEALRLAYKGDYLFSCATLY